MVQDRYRVKDDICWLLLWLPMPMEEEVEAATDGAGPDEDLRQELMKALS
jgi:hypothetical protein